MNGRMRTWTRIQTDGGEFEFNERAYEQTDENMKGRTEIRMNGGTDTSIYKGRTEIRMKAGTDTSIYTRTECQTDGQRAQQIY